MRRHAASASFLSCWLHFPLFPGFSDVPREAYGSLIKWKDATPLRRTLCLVDFVTSSEHSITSSVSIVHSTAPSSNGKVDGQLTLRESSGRQVADSGSYIWSNYTIPLYSFAHITYSEISPVSMLMVGGARWSKRQPRLTLRYAVLWLRARHQARRTDVSVSTLW